MSIRADFCGRRDDGGRVNTRQVGRRFVKKFDRAGESEIRILATDERKKRLARIARKGSVLIYKDRGSARRLEQGRVALVGEKGDLARSCFFESGHAGDFDFGACAG